MISEDKILEQLSQITDPDLNENIVKLGFVKDLKIKGGKVSFDIELTTPACPVKDEFKRQAETLVKAVEGVSSVAVTMTAAKVKSPLSKSGKGLENVRHIVAVSSCKGGVGKSTVAINLAYALSNAGGKVGIFDADVYGPSLPTMVTPDSGEISMDNKLIQPLEKDGVKLMSFGYTQAAAGEHGPAIMRGPVVTQVINQLLTQTNWGDLDYLVVDMPPGTGDIQLTLGQVVPLTAALIVTTPQQISFVDVVKGIEMFDKINVPTIGIVENMAFFNCDNCDAKHYVFGQGAMQQLIEEFGFELAVELPMDKHISPAGDSGQPFVIANPAHQLAEAFQGLAAKVVREISRLAFGESALPKVGYTPEKGILYIPAGKDGMFINPKWLRSHCKCAHCRDEFTGEMKLNVHDIPESIHPLAMEPVGNYALGINWSDGHSSLLPYRAIYELAKSQPDLVDA